jgi:hypothetical protein
MGAENSIGRKFSAKAKTLSQARAFHLAVQQWVNTLPASTEKDQECIETCTASGVEEAQCICTYGQVFVIDTGAGVPEKNLYEPEDDHLSRQFLLLWGIR